MTNQLRAPTVDPSESQAVLAELSLLPFLSISPSPSLVLRVAPLLEALRHRTATNSPLHSPAWSTSTYRPGPGSSAPSEGPLGETSKAERYGNDREFNADLLGGIEHLSMRTPSARAAQAATEDYFSLGTGNGSSGAGGGGGTTGGGGGYPVETSNIQLSAMEPAWKNQAWREGLQVIEGKATRRSSMAMTESNPASGVTSPLGGASSIAAAASAAARNLKETFARMTEGADDRDVSMRDRLGTVHEGMEEEDEDIEDYDNDERNGVHHGNDDYEPEGGVETWRASWNFLSQAEQQTVYNFLLDLLDQSELSLSRNLLAPNRRASVATSSPGESPHSSISALLPEDDDASPTSSHSTLRLPGLIFTAVLIPTNSTDSSPSHFIVLSTPPLLDTSRRLSDQYRAHRHSSTSSTLSATTPGPSLLQRQLQQQPLSMYRAPTTNLHSYRQGSSDDDEVVLDDPWALSLGNSEMARRIREHSWDETELGCTTSWPVCLKTTISSIIASPFRECILWGQNKLIIYNDRYIETAGLKHPELLGTAAKDCWAELWDELEPVANRALQGETVSFNDHFLTMERDGFLEETYHSFTYAPLRDGDSGDVVGILNLSIESTAAVIAARRLSSVRDLIQHTSLARTLEDFATSAMKALAKNPYDIPFAILYHVEDIVTKPTTREVRAGLTTSQRKTIKLSCKGSVGVSHSHPFLVHEAFVDLTPPRSRHSSSSASTTSGSTATAMDIRDRLIETQSVSSDSSSTPPGRQPSPQPRPAPEWTWPFEEACLKRQSVLVEDLGGFGETLEKRGWDSRARSAVVIPIRIDTDASSPSAVIVLGVNPMSKTLEENPLMKTFFDLISRHVAIGLYSVLAAEQDRHRAEELLSLDKAKSDFFSSVSHELRSPCQLIIGPLEDVLAPSQKKFLKPEHADSLELVRKHSTRLLNMVNKLLDFSSVEAGRMIFRFRPVQIGQLTRDLAILFKDAIERAKIEYVVECEDDPPDAWPIYLSPDLWERVILNIVGNALKYTEKGRITVNLKSTRGECVLSISDTGVGIPQSELGRIFERFHRVQSSSQMTTGTGIGLALTLELVKLIGGQLEVDSDFGRGSTFTVRLPRGYSHLPIEQVEHTAEENAPLVHSGRMSVVEEAAAWRLDALDKPSLSISTPSSRPHHSVSDHSTSSQHSGSGSGEDYLGTEDVLSLKNRTIVLVDDSRDLRTYMSSLLSTQFTVVPFADPFQALEFIKMNTPSLVVTDSMMPGLTGMELTQRIRQDPKTSLLPVIMVSAQAGSEARADALEGGVDDYLVKPFQPRELVARVRVHLQLGLMRVELEKRVEERTRALIDSESRNRALAERYSTLSTVSPVGIVQIDQEGNMVYANPAWYTISGHPPEKPLSHWKEDFIDEDVERMNRLWQLVVVEGQHVDVPDRQFRFKCGNWVQLELRASTEVGLPAGWVGALTDITRQKMAEESHIRIVEQRAADAEENRIQTERFLDMSSHELRNPLSGVWQNAEVVSASLDKYVELLEDLRDGELPSAEEIQALHDEMVENTEAMESILLCTSHQGRIADDILNVSKLNMGLLTINLTAFELIPRIVEVKRIFEAECSQKQIDLRLIAGRSVIELNANWIMGDPARLHQILLNFLSNSIKYTTDIPNRKITIRIEAYSSKPPERPNAMRVAQSPNPNVQDGVYIVVGVEDNGKGLTEEDLQKLFARFSQANPRSDQVRYPSSSGLGLYISKKLVELHSGFIEVESKVGVGSIFSFAIPVQRAAPEGSMAMDVAPISSVPMGSGARMAKRPLTSPVPSEISRSSKTSKTGPGPSSPAEGGPRPVKVLVVEDNLVNQKILCRQLKNAGYETQVANNGLEALEAFESDSRGERSINVCLCDIQMPVMTGLEMIVELRRREQNGELPRQYPCIAVTGNARPAQQEEMLQLGFNHVLSKPYTFTNVVERVEALKIV